MLDCGQTSTFIDLSSQVPIAKGRKQSIYAHPEDDRMLVKVLTDGPEPRRWIPRYSEYRYGSYRPWHREMSEYLAVLNRGSREIERLSHVYGFAQSTRGPALLVEKLTGPKGRLAPTLRDLVRATKPGSQERERLRAETEDFLADLKRARIIVADLHAKNIVKARERGDRLTVVDGLGERTILPMTQFSDLAYSAAFNRRKLKLLQMIDRAKRRQDHPGKSPVPA